LVIGGVAITTVAALITPNGREAIGRIYVVIDNLPITVLA